MNHSMILDLDYAAIEVNRDIIRLAYDEASRVYVVSKHNIPFSAPYKIALSGLLYRYINDHLEEYVMNDIELEWVRRVHGLVKGINQ